MSPFWKRAPDIKAQLLQYFDAADAALAEWGKAMRCFLEQGGCDEFRALDKATHRHESRADDLRWELELALYRRALLPESRDDILRLLEKYDHLPNLAENITCMLDIQRIDIPADLRARVAALVEANLRACQHLRQAIDLLFSAKPGLDQVVAAVDQQESVSDRIERELTIEIFGAASPIAPADRLQLRDVIQNIGDLSDTAEKLVRRVEIISLKTRI